ncbi:MAG: hypothetical protein OER88_04625, partial [Planctomycetota bacterium]|nr:hypothetical protein [Planctomycetota bacterium]
GRKHLTALVTGDVETAGVQNALDSAAVPHYARVRRWFNAPPLTPASGLLTANGKLKRKAIEHRFAERIEELYR